MKVTPNSLRIIVLVFFLFGCSSSGSKESTTTEDTVTATVTDSVTELKPIVIAEAEVKALEENLNEQFEKVYKDIVDTTKYVKVILLDNYNEYEGQDEAWEAELYFDKAFTLKFFKEIHVTGVAGGNDFSEYIIDNNAIIWGRVKYPYYEEGRNEKTIIQWGDKSGVIKSTTTYSGTANESLEDKFKTEQYRNVEAHLSSITNVLNNGKVTRETEDSISVIIIEEKENSDLIDSTKVIVPKIIYKQLKNRF